MVHKCRWSTGKWKWGRGNIRQQFQSQTGSTYFGIHWLDSSSCRFRCICRLDCPNSTLMFQKCPRSSSGPACRSSAHSIKDVIAPVTLHIGFKAFSLSQSWCFETRCEQRGAELTETAHSLVNNEYPHYSCWHLQMTEICKADLMRWLEMSDWDQKLRTSVYRGPISKFQNKRPSAD